MIAETYQSLIDQAIAKIDPELESVNIRDILPRIELVKFGMLTDEQQSLILDELTYETGVTVTYL